MTVAELIDILEKVPDKSAPVAVWQHYEAGYKLVDIVDFTKKFPGTDGTEKSVIIIV